MDQAIRIAAGFVLAVVAVVALVVVAIATGTLLLSIAVVRRLAR